MLDTKSQKLEKDIEGKVSLSEVIDLLKELQHEVHCSVQEIKTEKARKTDRSFTEPLKVLNVTAVPI